MIHVYMSDISVHGFFFFQLLPSETYVDYAKVTLLICD